MTTTRAAALLLSLSLAACGSNGAGYAIDFLLSYDTGVAAADRARATTLTMSVSGAETFQTSVDISGKLGSSERLRYKPGATTSGRLVFNFAALADVDVIASGTTMVDVTPGSYHELPVVLATFTAGDLGEPDGGAANCDPPCTDVCANGVLTTYACVAGQCQLRGGQSCGLYTTCETPSTCKSSCVADQECVSNAACVSGKCVQKSGLGGPCTAEGQDHECFAPYVCTWDKTGKKGICAMSRCTGCAAAAADGKSCSDYIQYGLDPRNACTGAPNTCLKIGCAGPGFDTAGSLIPAQCIQTNWGPLQSALPCGQTTCTNDSSGVGHVTGYLCVGGTCSPGQSTICQTCSDAYRSCFSSPCDATMTGCDYGIVK